jgi:peroxiredoxin
MPQLLLLVGLGLVLLGGVSWLVANRPVTAVATDQPLQSAELDHLAPDFELATLDGQSVALADYAGDVVVVNFWATWCPPCRAEMPGINAVYEAYKADGLMVLAVNAREDASLVNGFVGANDFTFPVLLDPNGRVVDEYVVHSFPTTFIIDRAGVIRHMQSGIISEEELEAIVQELLAG